MKKIKVIPNNLGQIVSLSCPLGLFLLSQNLISSANFGKYNYLEYFIAFLSTCLIFPLLSLESFEIFSTKKINKATNKFKKSLIIIFNFLVIICSFYIATRELSSFSNFVQKTMMKNYDRIIISILIIILCVYIASLDFEVNGMVLEKFSFFGFSFSLMVMILLFMCSIKNFKYENLNAIFYQSENLNFGKIVYAFIENFVLGVIPIIYVCLKVSRDEKKLLPFSSLLGAFLSLFTFSICYFNTALVLFSSNLPFDYPYLTSIGFSSYGKLFTRLDGIAYSCFFISFVFKISLCVSLINTIASTMLKKIRSAINGKFLPYGIGALLIVYFIFDF